jgi:hypothetical protein
MDGLRKTNLRHILMEFRQGLEALYGPRLVELVLFGSQVGMTLAQTRTSM